MRVYIGNMEIAGYYVNLKRGLDKLDVDCDLITFAHHTFRFDNSPAPFFLVRLLQHVSLWHLDCPAEKRVRKLLFKGFWILLREIFRPFIFIWAMCHYDVFIFRSTSNLLWFFDLPIMKLFGKRSIYVFHGSDSRPLYINAAIMDIDPEKRVWRFILITYIQKMIMKIINRHASVIVNAPSTGQFHERSFVNVLILGLPFEFDAELQATGTAARNDGRVRILHSPSRPYAKGTFEIRKMIERLEKKYAIDYVEIIDVPFATVMAEMQQCDLVIDALYSDAPTSGIATEAAFFEKPTMNGGYYAEFAAVDSPPECLPPMVYSHPDRFEADLEELIASPDKRAQIGRDAKRFMTECWTPELVASRYLRVVEDDIPDSWWIDPYKIEHFCGFGMSDANKQRFLKCYIDSGGIRALCLNDKPALRDRIIAFAANGSG